MSQFTIVDPPPRRARALPEFDLADVRGPSRMPPPATIPVTLDLKGFSGEAVFSPSFRRLFISRDSAHAEGPSFQVSRTHLNADEAPIEVTALLNDEDFAAYHWDVLLDQLGAWLEEAPAPALACGLRLVDFLK